VLLKVGAAMMLSTVALAAVVALVVSFSGDEEPAGEAASLEPLAAGVKEEPEREFDPGEKLEIDDEFPEKTREEPPVEEPLAEEPPAENPPVENRQAKELPAEEPRAPRTLPVVAENWPEPSREEVAATQVPRYYSPRRDSALSLTVNALGLYHVPVISSNNPAALDNGVIHLPQTPMPWEERQQKNVYLAGHRLGYPGTGSRLVFYNLDKLRRGDSIVLRDGSGNPYEYRVREVFAVEPDETWAVDPVRDRDMVTLQTCTFPDLQNRIIVRADRV
jgi:sortase A